jgi:NADH-quinone oxidoreductase subunit G
MEVGLYDSHVTTQKVHKNKHVNLGSNVMLDQERCVLCQRCTRFTANVTKTGELGIMGRGDHSYVGVMPGR